MTLFMDSPIDVSVRPTTARLARPTTSRPRGLRPTTSRLPRSPASGAENTEVASVPPPPRAAASARCSRVSRASAVTLWTGQMMRRCQLEQRIFSELLDLKKQQIRVGRFKEAIVVKRITEKYNKVV